MRNDTLHHLNCSRCGAPTEGRVGDVVICDSCYVTRGSCCPEFGVDDLSEEAIADAAAKPAPHSGE